MITLKSTLRALAASLLLTVVANSAMAQSAAPPKWFRYANSIEAAWTVSNTDPMRYDIQRKKKESQAPAQRVIVLYPVSYTHLTLPTKRIV